MAAPSIVMELVDRFHRNLDVFKRDGYKETRVRVEFIDPLFEALGWDVRNVQGHAEQYKDVIHEAALKMGGEVHAPTTVSGSVELASSFSKLRSPQSRLRETSPLRTNFAVMPGAQNCHLAF